MESELRARKGAFLEFEEITLQDIENTWKLESDRDYNYSYISQENLPYHWDDPLYMKMIHRFRNCGQRVAVFWNQLDPNERRKFLCKNLNHNRVHHGGADEILDFFSWLSNSIGVYEFEDNKNGDIELWRNKPIRYFFSLSEKKQQALISRYRLTCSSFWDVLGFESELHEKQLREACDKIGARLCGSEINPAFRYVVQASRRQIEVVAELPWIIGFHASSIRNVEYILTETAK